eukprot:TRINITY_DN8251_c0_g1_i1.p1 TRINITY_DN8251_c0_g1~~TRINITY_DN8251_c0_g1_i1.p1  ORF type:complete len:787 (-),score=145.74 TRINITY_DN8251_c0_g1_i1:294-2654(-)
MQRELTSSQIATIEKLHSCLAQKDVHSALPLLKSLNYRNYLGINGNTTLHYAVISSAKDIVAQLLNEGAKANTPNDQKDTPLHLASYLGDLSVVHVLLQYRADCNRQGFQGMTPLHYACQQGCYEVCELLLSAGARINLRDELSLTPLHIAVSKSSVQICKLLLQNQAVTYCRDRNGNTPLHVASDLPSEGIVLILLQHGCNIDAQNNAKETALHLACVKGSASLVDLLLRSRANPFILDAKSRFPRDVAEAHHHLSCAALLPNLTASNIPTPAHNTGVSPTNMTRLSISPSRLSASEVLQMSRTSISPTTIPRPGAKKLVDFTTSTSPAKLSDFAQSTSRVTTPPPVRLSEVSFEPHNTKTQTTTLISVPKPLPAPTQTAPVVQHFVPESSPSPRVSITPRSVSATPRQSSSTAPSSSYYSSHSSYVEVNHGSSHLDSLPSESQSLSHRQYVNEDQFFDPTIASGAVYEDQEIITVSEETKLNEARLIEEMQKSLRFKARKDVPDQVPEAPPQEASYQPSVSASPTTSIVYTQPTLSNQHTHHHPDLHVDVNAPLRSSDYEIRPLDSAGDSQRPSSFTTSAPVSTTEDESFTPRDIERIETSSSESDSDEDILPQNDAFSDVSPGSSFPATPRFGSGSEIGFRSDGGMSEYSMATSSSPRSSPYSFMRQPDFSAKFKSDRFLECEVYQNYDAGNDYFVMKPCLSRRPIMRAYNKARSGNPHYIIERSGDVTTGMRATPIGSLRLNMTGTKCKIYLYFQKMESSSKDKIRFSKGEAGILYLVFHSL